MKKIFKRILGIIFVLILGYQQFCYADSIVPSTSEILFAPLTFLLCLIVVIVLIIFAISFFCLKATVKKQRMQGNDSEKLDALSQEKIEKKKNKIKIIYYVGGIILAVSVLIYLWLIGSVVLSENYNEQFLQYQKKDLSSWKCFDVEGLINTAIKNNKSGRKTTIIYQNTNYTSPDELKELLSMLDTSKTYSFFTKYDNNYNYIETITLTSDISSFYDEFSKYKGEHQRGSNVKSLIELATSDVLNNNHYVNIVYTSETGQKTNINISTDNYEDIMNLRDEIETGKTYKIEFQIDDYNGVCNIIITVNN